MSRGAAAFFHQLNLSSLEALLVLPLPSGFAGNAQCGRARCDACAWPHQCRNVSLRDLLAWQAAAANILSTSRDSSCALVIASRPTTTGEGAAIDAHDLVIRLGRDPVVGRENDVGSRTSYRLRFETGASVRGAAVDADISAAGQIVVGCKRERWHDDWDCWKRAATDGLPRLAPALMRSSRSGMREDLQVASRFARAVCNRTRVFWHRSSSRHSVAAARGMHRGSGRGDSTACAPARHNHSSHRTVNVAPPRDATTARPFKLYIYPSALGCALDDECGHGIHRSGQLAFEELSASLVPRALVTTDPAAADLLYHPACLTAAYFRHRPNVRPLRALEERVLAEIHASGQAQRPHVVNALWCRGNLRMPRSQSLVYSTLWSRRFLRVCSQSLGAADMSVALYMPYLDAFGRLAPPDLSASAAAKRPHEVIFFGSSMERRWKYFAALRRMNHTRLVVFDRATGPSGVAGVAGDALMRSARFVAAPEGDAPESPRIYQALALGAIPLLPDRFGRPAFLPWENISFPLHIGRDGKLVLPADALRRHMQDALRQLHVEGAFVTPSANRRLVSYVAHGFVQLGGFRSRR